MCPVSRVIDIQQAESDDNEAKQSSDDHRSDVQAAPVDNTGSHDSRDNRDDAITPIESGDAFALSSSRNRYPRKEGCDNGDNNTSEDQFLCRTQATNERLCCSGLRLSVWWLSLWMRLLLAGMLVWLSLILRWWRLWLV